MTQNEAIHRPVHYTMLVRAANVCRLHEKLMNQVVCARGCYFEETRNLVETDHDRITPSNKKGGASRPS